tara:strand:+ start:274 stop:519 length:246 start_codon:yes stop_codon:yes gene_type:complete
MKKLILVLNFLRTGLNIRNLFISILGATAFLLIMFVIQFFIRGSIGWDNNFIGLMIFGAAVSLSLFEKPKIPWKEYWEKNK